MATSIKIWFPHLLRIGNKEPYNCSSNYKDALPSKPAIQKESANTVHLVIVWFQHASGLTTPILEPPHAASKYINSIWLSSFINLLSSHQVQIILKKVHSITPTLQ